MRHQQTQAQDRAFRVRLQDARHQLESLVRDNAPRQAKERTRLTSLEISAVTVILNELHRLNLAVSSQQRALEAIRRARTQGKKVRK